MESPVKQLSAKVGHAEFINGFQKGENWRLSKPRIDDDGTSYEALRQVATLSSNEAISQLRVLARANDSNSLQGLRLRVAASLLSDLIHIGWELSVDSHCIYVRPPKTENLTERKDSIRRQLLFGRNDQLAEESHRRFLFALERPSKYASTTPVTDLIADGRRLAKQLQDILRASPEQRPELLKQVCQPYLQLVSEERDQYTNIRLIDIWRYFRHGWATRYRSSPGRNLFYLIRDAAQPNHPVIGIAGLGNTVMQLTTRDRALGWTLEGLLHLIKSGLISDAETLIAFRRRLEGDYDQIFLDDLPVDRRIDHSIADETLSRLAVIEYDAQKEREDALKSDVSITKRPNDLSPTQLLELTRTPLYRSKRARVVREILKAYRILASWSGTIETLVETQDGAWAVGVVIKQLKKQFSATSMMEITVCGAVPPYNHLLGGKLACLMMLSPRVIQDYRERYNDVVSIIASQMAGRPVSKEPHLAFLGTTSLYTDYSAQYNRVRLPAGTVKCQTLPIEYRFLGRTEGFGSPNLSAETERGLAFLAEATKSYRNVNFMFGEGQSPKMRQLREGFAALGLNQTNLLQHGAPRIIYGVSLVGNTERILLGIDDQPVYAINPESKDAEAQIADYWIRRWLASRLNHSPALAAVGNSSPLKERVSRFIPDLPEGLAGQRGLFSNPPVSRTPLMQDDTKVDERLRFVRLLYRSESAFSDHANLARLKELNIRTKLEDVIRKIIRAGGSVVIIGNAGDGKTHAIRLLKNDLKDAEIITDASEHSPEEVANRWQEARDQGKPFCIAINEGSPCRSCSKFPKGTSVAGRDP